MSRCPCYGCDKRRLYCHASCAAYKQYRAEMDAVAAYREKYKSIDPMRVTHEMDKKNRRRKYKGGNQ